MRVEGSRKGCSKSAKVTKKSFVGSELKIVTRCPKAIHGHRYPCPTSDFSFFVIFCVSRAAAPEGTGGDGVLTSIF